MDWEDKYERLNLVAEGILIEALSMPQLPNTQEEYLGIKWESGDSVSSETAIWKLLEAGVSEEKIKGLNFHSIHVWNVLYVYKKFSAANKIISSKTLKNGMLYVHFLSGVHIDENGLSNIKRIVKDEGSVYLSLYNS